MSSFLSLLRNLCGGDLSVSVEPGHQLKNKQTNMSLSKSGEKSVKELEIFICNLFEDLTFDLTTKCQKV